jgi:quaternary ammonium compound-resistance protein SugE
MSTAWIYLVLAGVFEWGWPIGLKFAWRDGQLHWLPAIGAAISMAASGVLLFLAQRAIPVGTAYAVWTGIGAVGAFILGILILDEPARLARFVFVGFIVVGIVGLKLASP